MVKRALILLWFPLAACNATPEDEDGSETGPVELPEDGILGCPASGCSLVVVSQLLDDRIEVYDAGRGEFRGAIDLDFKPNPNGDNSDELLDEPVGITLTNDGLHVLVGHYPSVEQGSLLSFPLDWLAQRDPGGVVPQSAFFDGGVFSEGVRGLALGVTEPVNVVPHPSGLLLISVFNNDLFAAQSEWTEIGKLAIVDPASGEIGTVDLSFEAGDCLGAWTPVLLDDAGDTVAVTCDGSFGGVAVLDTSGIDRDAGASAAAASVDGCFTPVGVADKRTAYGAADGLGNVAVLESPAIASTQDARLKRFDAACEQVGATVVLPGPTIWDLRQMRTLRAGDAPAWLLTQQRNEEKGLWVIDGASGTLCDGPVQGLDGLWDGTTAPWALEMAPDGVHVVVSASPLSPDPVAAADGRLHWVELDVPDDPCETRALASTDLTALAPAVDDADPSTWRRAPNFAFVVQR